MSIRKDIQTEVFEFFRNYCLDQNEPSYVQEYLMGNNRKLTEHSIKSGDFFYINDPEEAEYILRVKFDTYERKISGLFSKSGSYFLLKKHRLIICFHRPYESEESRGFYHWKLEYIRGRYLEESGSVPPPGVSKYMGLSNISWTLGTNRFYTPYSYSDQNDILIAEGEFDTLIGCQTGVYTMGVLGATNINDYMITLLPPDKNIYVCFHNDEAGQEGVQRFADYLDQSVKSVILKDHKDLTDWYDGQEYPVFEDPNVEIIEVKPQGGK